MKIDAEKNTRPISGSLPSAELLLKSLYDSISESIFTFDRDYRYTSFNNEHALVMKQLYDVEIQLGHKFSEYQTLPDWKVAKENIDRALAGEVVTIETYVGEKEHLCFHVLINPVFSESGCDVIGVMLVARNISGQKELENESVLNEKRQESLIEVSHYNYKDIQDLLDFTLSEALKLTESKFGYIYLYDEAKKEFILNSWSNEVMKNCSVVDPQTRYQLEFTGLWGEAVRQAKPIIVNDFLAPHPYKKGMPEGHAVLNNFMTTPIFWDGNIVAVVGVANKKTDYNQSDVRHLRLLMDGVWKIKIRKQVEKSLFESEKRYKEIIDNAFDGFVIITREHVIDRVNKAFCDIVGYSSAELIGMQLSDLDVNIDEISTHSRIVSAVGRDHFETKYICKNKEIVDVEVSVLDLEDNRFHFAFVRNITKEKQHEKMLIESELRFKLLYQSAPLSYQSLNSNAQLIDVNATWLKTLGYSRDEVIGHYFVEFMTPESALLVKNRFPAFMDKGELHDYVFDMVKKDGSIITVSYDGNVGYDDQGCFKQTHCIFQDVTERVITQKRIRESEAKFRSLFESAIIGISMTSLQGELNVNNAFCEILGYSKDEFINLNWKTITHPDDVDYNEYVVGLMISGKINSERWTKRYIHKNGNIVWVDINSNLYRDEVGNPQYFITAITDITERKNNELKLQESEQRYKSLFFENISVMFILDPDTGCILDANPAACDFYGWTYEEICKKRIFDINIQPNPNVFEHLQNAKTKKRKYFQFIHRMADESLRDVEVYATTLLIENKNVLHVIIHDVTDKKQAEEKLWRSESHLKQAQSIGKIGSWELNFITGKLIWSDETYNIFGVNAVDFPATYDAFLESIYPADRVEIDRAFRYSMENNTPGYEIEHRIIRQDTGEIRYVHEKCSHQYEDGIIMSSLGIVQDITERKLAEKSLAESERRFRDLLSTVQMISLILDKQGNIVFCNDFLLRLTGWTRDEISGKNWFALFISSEVREQVKHIFGNAVETRNVVDHYENKIVGKNGLEYLIMWSNTALYDESGEMNGIASLGVDITEQRKAVESLHKSKDRLNRAEFATNSGNWELHIDTGLIKVSKGARKIYGLNSQVEEYENVKINSLAEFRPLLDTAMKNLIEHTIPYDVEFKIRTTGTNLIKDIHSTAEFDKERRIVFGVITDVTEKKRIEDSLAIYRIKLEAALSSMTDAIVISDTAGNLIEINYAFAHFHKFKTKGDCFNTFSEYPHLLDVYFPNGELAPTEMWALPRALRGEVATGEEYILNRKDTGETWYGSFSFSPIKNDDGEIVGSVVVARDITKQKEAEKALANSENQLKLVLRGSLLGFWDWDIVTGKVERNDRWAEILGYSLSEVELTVRSWSELIHPDDQAQAKLSIENHLAGITAQHSAIYRMRCKDGQWKWIHDRAQIVAYDSTCKPIRMCGTHEDISESKKIELALAENEKKLSALFTSMTEIVVIHKLIFDENANPVNYQILDCNDAFTKLTGIKKVDSVGRLATDIYNSTDPPYFENYIKVCASGASFDFKSYYSPMDMHFLISAVPLGGHMFATITTNITDIVKSKEAVLEKNNELENYIYVASHDLRSPLVNIQGFSQRLNKQIAEFSSVIEQSLRDNSPYDEFKDLANVEIPKSLKYILTNVAKMDKLINGLLQVSRTGRLPMTIRKLNTDEMINSIIMTHNFQLNEIGAEVKIGKILDCYGDENQLNQLFSNIISNAIKYRNTVRKLLLEITSEGSYNKVIYKIKDNGIGLSARHVEKIWDVFYRVDSTSDIEGDGLGLSLARRIADKHKGKIWVESEEGRGSVFYIELNKNEFTEN